jgi:protein kinase-like protein
MVNPFIHGTWVAVSLFLVALGLLVFASRPGGALNRVLGALLVLRGASDLFYELMRDAATPSQAFFALRVANWYDWPTLFLSLLFLHLVVPQAARRRARLGILAAAGAFTLVLFAASIALPSLLASGVRGPAGNYVGDTPQFLPHTFVTLGYAVQVGAVVLAGRAVASTTLTLLQRRRAALIGLAFGLLIANAGLLRIAVAVHALSGALAGDWLANEPTANVAWLAGAVVAAAGFGAFAWTFPRLAATFEGLGRRAFLGVGSLALLSGIFATLPTLYVIATGAFYPGNYSVRFLMVAGSAGCLALALVRYGLAGFGEPTQRRVAMLSQVALLAMLVLLPAGVALAWAGAGTAGLAAGLLMALGALTLAPAPLRAVAESLSRLVLVSSTDPATAAERARRYTAELERLRALGRLPGAADPGLAALRKDLGMQDRDHDMLAALLPDPARPREPPLLGRYRVERELGRGAFGTALLATDAATAERVVLKRFHAAGVEHLALAEARALTAVRHPRIVPLLAVERLGDEVFLVLAYAERGTVQQLLDREGPLGRARALAVVRDVLEGLDALHGAGLSHGDVKLSNILLDAGNRAMLGDLGSAKAHARPDADLTLTSSPVLGSYATLAPEVLRGGRRSKEADIYAAGAVLYQMLTGRHYIDLDGKDTLAIAEAILHDAPRLPDRRVPSDVASVVARALAKDPGQRFHSAAAMQAALEGGQAARRGPATRETRDAALGTPSA